MSALPTSLPDAESATGQAILVVEDDRDTRELIKLWLLDDGFEVTEAPSAEAATRNAPDSAFDLAMVDVMLPGVDGVHLAPELAPTPVLLMSVTDIDDLPREVGAAGFLSKPFSRAGLERAVRQALAPG